MTLLHGPMISVALTTYLKETRPARTDGPVNVEFRTLEELMRIAVLAKGAGLYALTERQTLALMDFASFTRAAVLFRRCPTTNSKATDSAPPQTFVQAERALSANRRLRAVVLLVHLVQGSPRLSAS